MVEPNWPEHLNDVELEELDQYLRSHAGEEDLLLDGVHGLLTAVAIGPDPITPHEWLSEILNDPFSDEEEGKRILELLARLSESVLLELQANDYEPILGEIELDDNSTALTASGWCEGFSRGVDMRARIWELRLGADSQLMEILTPIMALAVEEGVFSGDTDFAELSDEEYEECLAQLPLAVASTEKYWRDEPLTEAERKTLSNAQASAILGPTPRRRGGRSLH